MTEAEREVITAKYQRRLIELGTAIFGPPEELEERGPNAKAQEFERRIIDATIQLLEAVPPDDVELVSPRKPGDLNRTAERLRGEEVDLPEGFDRHEEAALLDSLAEFERTKIAFGRTMDSVAIEAMAGLLPVVLALKQFAADVVNLAKQWAHEDPEGPGAEFYRELNRAWREGAGRSRGRK